MYWGRTASDINILFLREFSDSYWLLRNSTSWTPSKLTSQSSQVCPTHTCDPPKKWRERKKCSICVAHTGAKSNNWWPASWSKLSPSPTTPPPEAINLESYTSASLSQFLIFLFHGFMSRLLLWGRGRKCHVGLLCSSFSTVRLQSSVLWQN